MYASDPTKFIHGVSISILLFKVVYDTKYRGGGLCVLIWSCIMCFFYILTKQRNDTYNCKEY